MLSVYSLEWLLIADSDAVTSILNNFANTFKKALEENAKLVEMEKKKTEKEAERERLKNSPLENKFLKSNSLTRDLDMPFSPRKVNNS